MSTIAVIDFETNGDPADRGGRPTEIAVLILRDGKLAGRYQSLMDSGVWISPFVEELTGITNEMAGAAPPAGEVMSKAFDLVGSLPLAAHNAAFDSKFWAEEGRRLGRLGPNEMPPFVCTMLLARRLYPEAPDHKLGTLAKALRIPCSGRAHRAMVDTEMAVGLLWRIQELLRKRFGIADAPPWAAGGHVEGSQRQGSGNRRSLCQRRASGFGGRVLRAAWSRGPRRGGFATRRRLGAAG